MKKQENVHEKSLLVKLVLLSAPEHRHKVFQQASLLFLLSSMKQHSWGSPSLRSIPAPWCWHNLSLPVFSSYMKCDKYFIDLYLKLNELNHVKYLEQCLVKETTSNFFLSLFFFTRAYQILSSSFSLPSLESRRYTGKNHLFCVI